MRNGYKVSITIGLLLIAAALSLSIYNLWDERKACEAAETVLEELVREMPTPRPEQTQAPAGGEEIPLSEIEIPDYILNPNMDMPAKEIDGREYIGTLEIPAFGLALPVMSAWSYEGLGTAPCRYSGSAYLDNMTIAAHNYDTHFGSLKNLRQGDRVTFTDMDGNVFAYEVAAIETLQPTAIEEMTAGEYPLSLFTCTIGGQFRVTVRCDKAA